MSLSNSEQVEVRTSSEWISDDLAMSCTQCHKSFDNFLERKHHCRLCGNIFCNKCTDQRALIPPSSIVLVPEGGKKVKYTDRRNASGFGRQTESFSPRDEDPDRQNTFLKTSLPQGRPSFDVGQSLTSLDPESELGSGTMDDLSGAFKDSTLSLAEQQEENKVQDEEKGREEINDTTHSNNYELDDEDDDYSYSVATSTDMSYSNQSKISNHYPAQQQRQHQQKEEVLLYGKGLEERMKLAREPLRVCEHCHQQLQYLQEELRNCNSNAMRYNSIDPTDIRRLLNSPLAFTLGHEVRKAAYTLNNLLPLPKRMGAFVNLNYSRRGEATTKKECEDTCQMVAGNFANVDGVKIPATLLEQAKGVAVMTIMKGGLGFAGFEFGTGLVVSRLPDGGWSPPCAIGTAGMSWGALVGLQLSDHVFLLMTDAAVDVMSSNEGGVQLGADIGVAVGPLGRNVGAEVGAAASTQNTIPGGTGGEKGGVAIAPIYTYSLSKGLYAGASLEGKVIMTRHRINEKFYGQNVDAKALLRGDVATPPAAQPLYDALRRCHAYASSDSTFGKKQQQGHYTGLSPTFESQFDLQGRS